MIQIAIISRSNISAAIKNNCTMRSALQETNNSLSDSRSLPLASNTRAGHDTFIIFSLRFRIMLYPFITYFFHYLPKTRSIIQLPQQRRQERWSMFYDCLLRVSKGVWKRPAPRDNPPILYWAMRFCFPDFLAPFFVFGSEGRFRICFISVIKKKYSGKETNYFDFRFWCLFFNRIYDARKLLV